MQQTLHHRSIFRPLRHTRFRQLWLANFLSNLGAWVQAFAVAWHITALSKSAVLTSLLQTATWAPMLLFALPAGMLADSMHRPRLLWRSNAAMGLTAGAMGLLSVAGTPSAALLLVLTFILGAGATFTLPAWQVSMASLAQADEVAAVASLHNLSYNLAALAGPCLGGLLFHQAGPAPLYVFNALSFCALLWFYRQWQTQEPDVVPPGPRRAGALRAALAAVWRTEGQRRLVLYSALVFCASNAFFALLPLLVRDVQHADASTFGMLMGSLGAGAVLASAMLPRLRRHVSRRTLLSAATTLYGAMLLTIGCAQSPIVQWLLIACGGTAWCAIVTTLNAAALSLSAGVARARTLSVYIFMVALGQTIGGALWGQLASRTGIVPAMMCAGLAMLVCAVSIQRSTDFLEQQ